jgi:hypothetical protein
MPNWELILHHTYSGTPGVVYDSSPRHGSHGQLQDGLAGSDFVPDGASPGSGAVGFPKTGSTVGGSIQVPTISDSWAPLEGIYCEIICLFDAPVALAGGGNLLSTEFFTLGVGDFTGEALPPGVAAWVEFHPDPGDPAWTVRVPVGDNPWLRGVVPFSANEWVTLGFLYDGLSTAQILVNGVVAGEVVEDLPRMGTPQLITIGPIFGLIDDVKIWRLNPQRITDNFLDRPMDSSTAHCLLAWLAQSRQVLAADPQCAERFMDLLDGAMRIGLVQVLAGDDATRQLFQQATKDYQQAWNQGRFDDVARIIADLSQLPSITAPFAENDSTLELLKDPCVRQILAALPPLTCDPELSALAQSIAAITPVPGSVS